MYCKHTTQTLKHNCTIELLCRWAYLVAAARLRGRGERRFRRSQHRWGCACAPRRPPPGWRTRRRGRSAARSSALAAATAGNLARSATRSASTPRILPPPSATCPPSARLQLILYKIYYGAANVSVWVWYEILSSEICVSVHNIFKISPMSRSQPGINSWLHAHSGQMPCAPTTCRGTH